ncbi:MAG: hypothetical protein ACLTYN_04605 [Dysosmobacter welbionis]
MRPRPSPRTPWCWLWAPTARRPWRRLTAAGLNAILVGSAGCRAALPVLPGMA